MAVKPFNERISDLISIIERTLATQWALHNAIKWISNNSLTIFLCAIIASLSDGNKNKCDYIALHNWAVICP